LTTTLEGGGFMRILVHTDAQAFADVVRPLLAEEEALNALPLGLLGRPAAGSDRSSWWTVRRAGVTAGAVLRIPPWPWTVSRFRGDRDRFARLVGDHLGDHADLPGEVHGAQDLALAVAGRWAERVGATAELTMRMRVMACTDLRPATAPGAARAIGPGDVQWVANWLRAFEDEAGLTPTSPATEPARAAVARDVEQGRSPLWVWEVGGDPVSLAGIGRPTPTGERIGPVYTPPRHRGRGYAGALVALLTAQAFERGRGRVLLFTDAANPTSNALYERLGYHHVGDAANVKVVPRAGDPPAGTDR
jgi:RimJ/RimL family protein N-acetyltransferase